MKIDIVIPTLNRPEKLKNCINSIIEAEKEVPNEDIIISIYYNTQEELYWDFKNYTKFSEVHPRVLEIPYTASTFWNNHFKNEKADLYYYLNDDVLVDPNIFLYSINEMAEKFPDLDGVIGLKQKNIPENQVCKAAFGCIGNKFIERFPNRKVFCEEYKRFYLDQELYLYATKVNKFYYSQKAVLEHLHPAFDKTQMDSTHVEVRKYLQEDKTTFNTKHFGEFI